LRSPTAAASACGCHPRTTTAACDRETNLPPRVPPQHTVNQTEPPPPQAPRPPTNRHAAPPPATEPPRIARVSGPRPSGVPPKDEHRYVPDEVLFELRAGVSPQTIDEITRRQRLQRLASQNLELIGTTLYAMLEAAAAAGALGENAAPIIEQRSAGPSDSTGRPAAKGAELPQNPPPVDQNPRSLKADAQPDSKSLPTATDAELAGKEEVLWQLKKDGLISMDQFQRQLQDLEAAKRIFINKCPAAPHLPG
jgi:hypothetical protein